MRFIIFMADLIKPYKMTDNRRTTKSLITYSPGLTFLLFLLVIIFTSGFSYAQTWVNVGNADFSDSSAQYTSIAIDRMDTPYVVYQDLGHSGKATVKKFNGSSWINVGIAGFSAGQALYTSIAIDSSGIPYVIYEDMSPLSSGKATVMKYNGSNWVNVGVTHFSAGVAKYTSIAIDPAGTPYVVYQDGGTSNKASVMKFNGANWVVIGSLGLSVGDALFTSIAIDGNGTPYVVFEDIGDLGIANVLKYNGTNWINIGGSGPSMEYSKFTSIAIDNNGTPYIAFTQADAVAMKYIDSSFVIIGSAGFTGGIVQSTSIAVDSSGMPYVVYQNWGSTNQEAGVMNFNGSDWVTTGNSDFSPIGIQYPAISINKQSVPYVVYQSEVTGRVSVMKLDTGLHPIAGRDTICIGDTTTLTDATMAGTWSSSSPYIASINTGVATGLITGTTTISYTVPEGTATFLLTVGTCITEVKNISNVTSSLSISPNPSQGTFTLNLSSQSVQTASITITNTIGQKVKELIIPANKDVSIRLDASPCIYFLSATAGNEKVNSKIVIE